jgi:hypothetical protein
LTEIDGTLAKGKEVLRHCIVPNFKAQGEGLSSVDVIARLLEVESHPSIQLVNKAKRLDEV